MMTPFDRFASFYDAFMQIAGLENSEKILEFLSLQGGERILDVGGGTGRLGAVLAKQAGEVWVLDESAEMLKKVKVGINAVQRDALVTGFEGDSFDVVTLSDVLHHVREQKRLLAEIFRVLKPGGILLVQEFDAGSIGMRLFAAFERLLFEDIHFLSRDQLLTLCGEGGFRLTASLGGCYYLSKWKKGIASYPYPNRADNPHN